MPRSRSRSYSRSPARSPIHSERDRSASPLPPRSRSPSRGRSRSRGRSASFSSRDSRSPSPPPNPLAEGCPFLIRVFVLRNKHNPVIEYDQKRFPTEEYRVYAWKHSTPSQILKQLYAKFPPLYRSALRFSLRHVYVDAEEDRLYKARDLVSFTPAQLRATLTSSSSSAPADDVEMDSEERREKLLDAELDDPEEGGRTRRIEEKTLDEYEFLTGDLLSLCVALPRPPKAGGAGGPGALKAGGAPEPRGAWGRGEPLPPQDFRRGSGDRGGRGGRGGRAGDSWKRDRSRSPAREGWRR